MRHHWKVVDFDCGHKQQWIYPEEFGDGSAWCQWCGDLRDYENPSDAVSEGDPSEIRPPLTDADWGWRAALTGEDRLGLT